ncbi:MAG TPA: FecR domain-containing protein [Rhizomicrobium sp.]|nr:FecR domain-containing protein [Rhizomicrobium sp.]
MTGLEQTSPSSADETDARAAAFLYKQHDVGTWSDDDQAELDGWLNESFANRTAYWRLEAAWERANRLNALRPMARQLRAAKPEKTGGLPIKIAAAAVLITAVGASIWKFPARESTGSYATPIGAHERITLADGTRIELNTNSELRLEKNARNRVVRLVRGEAFFEVRHDAARPFIVLAQGHRVVDLGTKFVVREQQGGIRVSVLEGSARLEAGEAGTSAKAAVLKPGDVALATEGSIRIEKEHIDTLQTQLGWQRGVLVFHHATLAEVASEYNRYNDRRIVIADPEVAKLTISATLPTNDVDGFARMAQNFLGLHVKNGTDRVVITH